MNSQTDPSKRFYIHTIGCKVNQYESQAMRENMARAGFKECLSKEIADIYILNTCTVTHHADKESRYLVGMFHRTNPKAHIVVTGCYVEKNADEISFLPGISHIIRNEDKSRIGEILEKGSDPLGSDPNSVKLGLGQTLKGLTPLPITDFKGHTKAFVKIQDGCENRCSYCKVPLVRSTLMSKPLDKIVEEVSGLVSGGFKEIILVGICLGAWGKRGLTPKGSDPVSSVVDVLKALEKLDGDFRIRLSSIEPGYVTDELIDFIASSKKVCRHLHIPLQSGDDETLKRMNRPYTTADYKRLVEKLRKKMEDMAITTDIMVAFPGEADANFKNTVNFVKDILPARTHIFTFSKRDGTPAFNMGPEVSPDTAKKRYYELKSATLGASYLYRERFLGKPLDILVESKRDRNSGCLTGYSDNYIKVLFDGPDELMRRIVPIRIESINLIYTKGIYEPQ